MRNDRFNRGHGVYPCGVCGRKTRYTGSQSLGSALCPECFELAGIENEISDGYYTQAEKQTEIDSLKAIIAAKGGSTTDWFPSKA